MTSTANLMNFYGINVSPSDFQNWLTQKWSAAPQNKKARYITAGNDFPEEIVEEYTRELYQSGAASKVISLRSVHRTAKASNLAKIISELRTGHAVKLRVPNGHTAAGYKQYGHYVLAYGLVDPSKPDSSLSKGDILIMDPGNGGVYTLEAYGKKGYDTWHPGWLEDDKRVYLYDDITSFTIQPFLLLMLYYRPALVAVVPRFGDPSDAVNVVLTDSTGNRLGLDPAGGSYAEIPNATCVGEETYYTLDDDPDFGQPAWEYPLVQHIRVPQPINGAYSVEIIGSAKADYVLEVQGYGSAATQVAPVVGTVTAGQRLNQIFSVAPRPPSIRSPVALVNSNLLVTVDAPGISNITLETSVNLRQWTEFGSAANTNGAVVFPYPVTNAPTQIFFRAH
jgi:hypothetical protein